MAKTNSGPVLGIDLGGTNMQFGVVDANGKVIGRAKKKTKAEEGLEKVIDRLVDGANDAAKEAKLTLDQVQAVGIAAAGAIDTPNGVILESPNLGWRDVPFRDLLKKKLNRPVVLENDVNGAVWGEYLLGAAKGRGDCFGVWVGTGVGGGLVLNGKIYRGDFFTAGEVGHTVIDPHEPRGLGIEPVELHAEAPGVGRALDPLADVFAHWLRAPGAAQVSGTRQEWMDSSPGISRARVRMACSASVRPKRWVCIRSSGTRPDSISRIALR